MLPLNSSQEPRNKDELIRALNQGLSTMLKLPRAGYAVVVDGEFSPDLDNMTIDLNGAIADPANRPEPPVFQGAPRPAFTVQNFRMQALPLRVGTAPLNLELDATQMRFDYRTDDSDKLWLVPDPKRPADSGRVLLSVTQRDLQDMILSSVVPAAREHGVGIEDVKLKLEQRGPRKIRAELQAAAKKFMMKASVHLGATVEIDDQLNAIVSELHAGSEGMIGTMVSSLLGPKLKQYEGKRFALSSTSMGGLRLHDLQISVMDNIKIDAKFG